MQSGGSGLRRMRGQTSLQFTPYQPVPVPYQCTASRVGSACVGRMQLSSCPSSDHVFDFPPEPPGDKLRPRRGPVRGPPSTQLGRTMPTLNASYPSSPPPDGTARALWRELVPPGSDVVRLLNGWWQRGQPSNVVTEAGVLLRQFDDLEVDELAHWLQCDGACAETDRLGSHNFTGIWPSSIINARHHRNLFYPHSNDKDTHSGVGSGASRGGYVLAPPPLNRFFCAYPGDGHSRIDGHTSLWSEANSMRHGCKHLCDESKNQTYSSHKKCAYAPERLRECLQAAILAKRSKDAPNRVLRSYNEVVVDARRVAQNLPYSLLGVFYTEPSTYAEAADRHSRFLATYTHTRGGADFPLMHLSLRGGGFAAAGRERRAENRSAVAVTEGGSKAGGPSASNGG